MFMVAKVMMCDSAHSESIDGGAGADTLMAGK